MWPHYSLHSKLNALLRFHYCVRQDSLTDRVSPSSACISIRCPAADAERSQFRLILKTSFAFGLRVVPLVRPRFARALRVERHHRLDLSRGAVRSLLLRCAARLRGTAQSAQESAGSRPPRSDASASIDVVTTITINCLIRIVCSTVGKGPSVRPRWERRRLMGSRQGYRLNVQHRAEKGIQLTREILCRLSAVAAKSDGAIQLFTAVDDERHLVSFFAVCTGLRKDSESAGRRRPLKLT